MSYNERHLSYVKTVELYPGHYPCPVELQASLCILLYILVRVTQLRYQNVQEQDQDREKEHHHQNTTHRSGKISPSLYNSCRTEKEQAKSKKYRGIFEMKSGKSIVILGKNSLNNKIM